MEGSSRYRQYGNVMSMVIATVAVLFSLYHVAYVTGLLHRVRIFLDTYQHLAIHLAFMQCLIFLLVPVTKQAGKKGLPIYDLVLALLGVGWNLYILLNYKALWMRHLTGYIALPEVIGSWINILIVLEATRRILGWSIPVVACLFIAYSLTSHWFPGFLYVQEHSWQSVGQYIGLFANGMYGNILNISATIVVSFILFSQFLFVTGAGDWFIKIANALLGYVRGGPAKVAILSSALMGTLSGSGMANVATTGVFTIPLMKRTGYKPSFAGGVEAAASNGGQIMPPVMGITAFIMVDFLNIPYSKLIVHAALPALAYFLTVYLMVDIEAAKMGLRGIPREECPRLKETLMEGWQFFIPLILLMFLLVSLQYSAEYSAMFAILSLLILGVMNRRNRLTLSKVLEALKTTAFAMMMMATILAVAGVIVGCVQLTGLSYRLSTGLVELAAGNMWLLLFLTAGTAIILGMGMTTSAVYITLAILVAPALVKVGFLPLAAHMFVLYFGVFAMVTPPVCPVSYVAAGIAQSDPMKTGIEGSRLSVLGFVVPFIFIFRPALLGVGGFTEILFVVGITLVASCALAYGLIGFFFGPLHFILRGMLLTGSLFIVYPHTLTDYVGLFLIAAPLVFQFVRKTRTFPRRIRST